VSLTRLVKLRIGVHILLRNATESIAFYLEASPGFAVLPTEGHTDRGVPRSSRQSSGCSLGGCHGVRRIRIENKNRRDSAGECLPILALVCFVRRVGASYAGQKFLGPVLPSRCNTRGLAQSKVLYSQKYLYLLAFGGGARFTSYRA